MIDNLGRKIEYNNLLLYLTVFSLTIFVYKDFDIPSIVGYFLIAIGVLSIFTRDRIYIRIDSVTVAFVLLLLFQVFEIIRSIITGNSAQALYIPSCLMFVLCAFIVRSNEKSLLLISKIWLTMSCFVALYSLSVKLYPALYYSGTKQFLSTYSREMNDKLLDGGYGIAIGGNIIIIQYILAFAVLFLLNSILLNKTSNYYIQLASWFGFVVFILAMLAENRKSEILALAFACVFLLISKINYKSKQQYLRNWVIFFSFIVLTVISIVFLYNMDLLGRYGVFIDKVLSGTIWNGDTDITSGRLRLWGIAWGLFLSAPVFGVGWGNFHLYIPNDIQISLSLSEINNAHNCYLQILCETGIFGFLIYVGLMFFIFIRLKHLGEKVNWNNKPNTQRILFSTCMGYQVFFFVVGAVDPAFYSLLFLCLYSIMVLIAREIVCKEEKVLPEGKENVEK